MSVRRGGAAAVVLLEILVAHFAFLETDVRRSHFDTVLLVVEALQALRRAAGSGAAQLARIACHRAVTAAWFAHAS